jgi:hypothetical protein
MSPPEPGQLYRVDLPYACFGIVGVNSIVMEAAPIAGWMVGKHLDDMKSWTARKGGSIAPIDSATLAPECFPKP